MYSSHDSFCSEPSNGAHSEISEMSSIKRMRPADLPGYGIGVTERDPNKVYFVLDHENAREPRCKRPGSDAGYDIGVIESGVIPPGGMSVLNTGVICIPPIGYRFQVEMRSSMAMKGLCYSGGVIDSGYTGAVKLILFNMSESHIDYVEGDFIAQLVLERNYSGSFPVEAMRKAEAPPYLFAITGEGVRGKLGFGYPEYPGYPGNGIWSSSTCA